MLAAVQLTKRKRSFSTIVWIVRRWCPVANTCTYICVCTAIFTHFLQIHCHLQSRTVMLSHLSVCNAPTVESHDLGSFFWVCRHFFSIKFVCQGHWVKVKGKSLTWNMNSGAGSGMAGMLVWIFIQHTDYEIWYGGIYQSNGICAVDSQKNNWSSCHQMSDFKAKMHQNRLWLGLSPRPCLESLYSARTDPLGIKGTYLLGKGTGAGKRKEWGERRIGKRGDSLYVSLLHVSLINTEDWINSNSMGVSTYIRVYALVLTD